MDRRTLRLTLHPFTAEEARRVIAGTPGPADVWADGYPLEDERDPLRSFVARVGTGAETHPFTLYALRERATGRAIGGLGFYGPPDPRGVVTVGYGLVAVARGHGFATEAVREALAIAWEAGARLVAADTAADNVDSQRVLLRAGFREVRRTPESVFFESPARKLHDSFPRRAQSV